MPRRGGGRRTAKAGGACWSGLGRGRAVRKDGRPGMGELSIGEGGCCRKKKEEKKETRGRREKKKKGRKGGESAVGLGRRREKRKIKKEKEKERKKRKGRR